MKITDTTTTKALLLLAKEEMRNDLSNGKDLLQEIFRERKLDEENLILYKYLRARLYLKTYISSKNIEDLKIAHEYLCAMNRKQPKGFQNQAYYTIAFVSFLLFKATGNGHLLSKAERITERALSFNSENSSFLFLNGEIEKFKQERGCAAATL